jgi:hypothetical protein
MADALKAEGNKAIAEKNFDEAVSVQPLCLLSSLRSFATTSIFLLPYTVGELLLTIWKCQIHTSH